MVSAVISWYLAGIQECLILCLQPCPHSKVRPVVKNLQVIWMLYTQHVDNSSRPMPVRKFVEPWEARYELLNKGMTMVTKCSTSVKGKKDGSVLALYCFRMVRQSGYGMGVFSSRFLQVVAWKWSQRPQVPQLRMMLCQLYHKVSLKISVDFRRSFQWQIWATDNPGDQTQTHYPINQPQTEDVEQQVGIDNVGDNSDYIHDVPRRSLRLFNRENNASVYAVHVPRALHKSDECVAAKLEKLDKLKEFEVFEEVPYNGQSCVATRWVLTYKGDKIRARLLAKGFQEHESMRVDSPTVGKPVVRLTMAIAASKGWQIQLTDVKSAFLQGNPPDRDIFVIPPVGASASDSYVWKLKKSLYGLNDAAQSFHLSLVSELKKLGCVQSGLDNTLFYLIRDNELQGVIVSHVDDLLHAGSGVFEEEVMIPLRQRFTMGRVESHNFKYVGLNVSQSEMHEIEVDRNHYLPVKEFPNVKTRHCVDKTEELNGEEYSLFPSMVGAANWMVMGTRPDVGYDVLELNTKSRSACVGDLRRAEKILHRLSESEANLLYPCLGPSKDWSLVLFADASHANLPDGVSSTLGYVSFLWVLVDPVRLHGDLERFREWCDRVWLLRRWRWSKASKRCCSWERSCLILVCSHKMHAYVMLTVTACVMLCPRPKWQETRGSK